jgi:hypothetical protein
MAFGPGAAAAFVEPVATDGLLLSMRRSSRRRAAGESVALRGQNWAAGVYEFGEE